METTALSTILVSAHPIAHDFKAKMSKQYNKLYEIQAHTDFSFDTDMISCMRALYLSKKARVSCRQPSSVPSSRSLSTSEGMWDLDGGADWSESCGLE